jgi:hypothetical protein
MAYADSFAECMQGAGVQVDPGVVSDEATFGEAIAYIKSWFDDLPQEAKEPLDDASVTGEPVAAFLVDANVAPSVPDLMQAFDQAVGMPLSTLLEWCVYCDEQAKQSSAEA